MERLLQAEIARVSRLVDDLLLLAKAEQTQFLRIEPIALAGYVQELWDGMSLLAERRFELGPLPQGTLRADPDRLAQALRNLIGNAIDHTVAKDGLVRMLVRDYPGRLPAIRRRGRWTGDPACPARAHIRPLLPYGRSPRSRLRGNRSRPGDRARDR